MLGQRFVGFEQFCSRVVVEARVRSQEFEELRQGSLEANLAHDRLHLGVNAADLLQPELVNLLGRHIRGGVLAHKKRVHRLAARHLPHANLVEAGGQILVNEELLEMPVSGHDARDDGVSGRLRQPRAVALGDSGSKALERFIKGAGFRVGHNLLVNLGGNALHDDFRQQHALAHALAHEAIVCSM